MGRKSNPYPTWLYWYKIHVPPWGFAPGVEGRLVPRPQRSEAGRAAVPGRATQAGEAVPRQKAAHWLSRVLVFSN